MAISCLMFASCEKATEAVNTLTNAKSSCAFKVNGNTIKADSASAVMYSFNGKRMIDVYVFKGFMNDSVTPVQIMEMHFQPITGSYPANKDTTGAWLTYFEDTTYFDGTTGMFTLATCDTVKGSLAGSFNFTGSNPSGTLTRVITEGALTISSIKKQ